MAPPEALPPSEPVARCTSVYTAFTAAEHVPAPTWVVARGGVSVAEAGCPPGRGGFCGVLGCAALPPLLLPSPPPLLLLLLSMVHSFLGELGGAGADFVVRKCASMSKRLVL